MSHDDRSRFVRNLKTGTMHYSEDGKTLACGRTLARADWTLTIYGIHIWCQKCADVDDKRQRLP